MQRTTLGRTGISVSALCLGSMTWGSSQNTEADGHAQIDMALDHGIDFIDTAEMYPVNPVSAETVGNTEAIIGSWIAKTGRRDDIVLATKVSGPGQTVRPGQPVSPASVTEALEGSLRRLRTDHVDLYQLHWPNRGSYHFRQMWRFDPSKQDPAAEIDMIHAVMERLKALVTEGKIRAFGLSNESAWGTMQWLKAAEATGGPRIAAIQNEYSLLCRQYDTDLAELGCHEEVTLLAFSPLAAGLLTGKYQDGAVPEGSRMSLNDTLGGRKTERVFPAVAAYLDIAARHGLDPAQMAIAWCLTRPFPTIPIFGATSEAQLRTALGAAEVRLGEEVLAEIDAAHRAQPYPY
jgi:aryl-alcohol dehydrogenase-like predicted oxidoreductase